MPMYQVKPLTCGDVKIDLPTCMYKLPNIHADGSGRSGHQNGQQDLALRALEARQDEILRRLYELKAAVDGLTKSVSTPDADVDATGTPHVSVCLGDAADVDLNALLGEDRGALRDIVINANPSRPPLSLLVLHHLLCQRYRVLSSIHVHSSVSNLSPALLSCLGPPHAGSCQRHDFQLGFTLIWKEVSTVQMKFNMHSMCPVEGEANVARFLHKLLVAPSSDPVRATLIDSLVDTTHFQLAEGEGQVKAALHALGVALERSSWLAGAELTLADIVGVCSVLRSGSASSAPTSVQRWLKCCESTGWFDCVYALVH